VRRGPPGKEVAEKSVLLSFGKEKTEKVGTMEGKKIDG